MNRLWSLLHPACSIVVLSLCFFPVVRGVSQAEVATPLAAVAIKDSQAVSILNSLKDASGGASVDSLQDFTAIGVFTHYWANKEVMGDATITGLGTDHFQVDESLPDGQRTWTMKGLIGSRKDLDGKVSTLALHEVLNADRMMYFLPQIVFALNDPLTTVSYVGLESMKTGDVHHLRILPALPAVQGIDKKLGTVTVKDLFIDAKTFLLVKLEDQAQRIGTSNDPLPRSLSYSDYRDVQGVLMPFTVDETINGVPVLHFETTSLSLNTGLTDSNFFLMQ
jgi:hypothetical protein